MKSKGYQLMFVVGLLNLCAFGIYGEKQNEEFIKPIDEYIQIFRNIPALFEYMLDALEQRPEILEKNDVALFNSVGNTDPDEYESFDRERKPEKRDADCNDRLPQDKHASIAFNIKQIEAGDYEYGNSDIITKGLNLLDSNAVIPDTTTNNGGLQNLDDTKKKSGKEILKRQNNFKSVKNRNAEYKLYDEQNNRDNGDTFFGFENLFELDLKPEEIEERILTAEKLLDDHNNKQDKKE